MRRLLLAAAVALAPGLAFAQSADNNANPPPPSPGMDAGPMMGPMGGHWGKGRRPFGGPEQFLMDFYAANTTHDGHLTLAQAKAANLKPIVDNFTAIDVSKRGYVTFYDIQAWRLDEMAQRMQQQADALRAQDK